MKSITSESKKKLMCGHLFKQSEFLKQWNERYFVLENNCLCFFAEKPESKKVVPRHLIKLEGSVVGKIVQEGKRYTFTLTVGDGTRIYRLAANTLAVAEAWVQTFQETAKVEFSIEKAAEIQTEEFNDNFSRLPEYVKELYTASQHVAPGWKLHSADAMVSLYYAEAKPAISNAHVLSVAKTAFAIYAAFLGINFSLGDVGSMYYISAILLGYFWVVNKNESGFKIVFIAYFFLLYFLTFMISGLVVPIFISILLSPCILEVLDKEASESVLNFIFQFGQSHYKTTIRVDKPAPYLLKLMTSYSYQFRHFCDVNLASSEMISRSSHNKTVGKLVYNSATPKLFRNRELIVEQEWFYPGRSTYIISERSIPHHEDSSCVRALFSGGIVIEGKSTAEGSYSIVTMIGKVDMNSWPIINLLVNILVPCREPKSIFALEANIKVAPTMLDDEDDDVEIESDSKIDPIVGYIKQANDTLKLFKEFALGDEKNGWNLVNKVDGVAVHSKIISPNVSAFRGQGRIPFSAHVLTDLLTDPSKRNIIDSMLEVTRPIYQINASVAIEYLQYKAVWPTSARDFCALSVKHRSNEGEYFLCAKSTIHPNCPDVSGNVRGEVIIGGYYIKPVEVNGSEECDGSLPASVVNMVATKQPMIVSVVRKYLESQIPDNLHRIKELWNNIKPEDLELGAKVTEEPQPIPKNDFKSEYISRAKEAFEQFKELALGTEKEGWKLVTISDGVSVHSKLVSQSISAFRGSCLIRCESSIVADLLTDDSKRSTIDSMLEKQKLLLNVNPSISIEYLQYKAVWPTAARDFCNLGIIQKSCSGEIFLCAKSINFPDCPEVKGNVRGEIISGGYYIKPVPGKEKFECELTYLSCTDLKGSLPSSVVAMVSKEQPMIVSVVRKCLENYKPENLDRVKILLESSNPDDLESSSISSCDSESVTSDARATCFTIAEKALSSLLEMALLPEDSWELLSGSEDVQVYSKDVKGSNLKMIKGVGIVEASPDIIMQLISDPDKRHWFDEMCSESEVLDILDGFTNIVYNAFEAKNIFCQAASRDFVMVTRRSRLPDGTCCVVGKSIPHGYTPNNKRIRGVLNLGGWIIRPSKKSPNRSQVIYVVHLDLGGSVPTWIANLIADKQPLCINQLQKLFSDKPN